MVFEPIANSFTFEFEGFPKEWIPLAHLYDPDLPLFPLMYFHVLAPGLTNRPGLSDRAYGFVSRLSLDGEVLKATVLLNKDLTRAQHTGLKQKVEIEVMERLGLRRPVTLADVRGSLTGTLAGANQLVEELWYKVVQAPFGDKLPFGRSWDPVFGLGRWIASWNSDGGRKAELIQLHSFSWTFGEKVPMGADYVSDFYLFPTFEEFTDTTNPLNLFPKFKELLSAAGAFRSAFCSDIDIVGANGSVKFSKFNRPFAGRINKHKIIAEYEALSQHTRPLLDNMTAFNRGPQRSVIALQMIDDLRMGRWNPASLDQSIYAQMYNALEGAYQSSKVIQLYMQQCFASESALPVDLWINSFLDTCLNFSASASRLREKEAIQQCSKWGMLERLIWVSSQGRKVHSSPCEDILWCVRFGDEDGNLRKANPLACKLCDSAISSVCPALAEVRQHSIAFNADLPLGAQGFRLDTSQGNNTAAGQTYVACSSPDDRNLSDTYSSIDKPAAFRPFPPPNANVTSVTVEDFLNNY